MDPKNYNLSDDGNELHKVTNTNIKSFEGFIDDLKENSVRLKTLRELLMSRPP